MMNILKILIPILVLVAFPAVPQVQAAPEIPKSVTGAEVTYQPVAGTASAGVSIEKLQAILAVGEFKTIRTNDNILRIAVAMPDVADYSVISKREILIQGKKTGTTGLNIWMKGKMDNYLVEVIDPTRRKPRQIRMKVRVMEISEKATKTLGIDWGTWRYSAASSITTPTGLHDEYLLGSGSFSQGGGGRILPGFRKGYSFTQIDPFMAFINALIDSGIIRVLSEPEVVALAGAKSEVLIGGEFPVPISSANSGVTILWKEYGIRMTLEPDVDEDNRITADIFTEVSTLDNSSGVIIAGSTIPALKITRATSKIHARSGKSVFLSGLKSEKDDVKTQSIPVLSDLPILGKAFSTQKKTKETTELIISVTPFLVEED